MHTAGLRVRYAIRVELLAHHIEHRYYDFRKVRVCDGLCFFTEPIAATIHSDTKSHQLRYSIRDNSNDNINSKKNDNNYQIKNIDNKVNKAKNDSSNSSDCNDNMESDI